MRFRDRVRSFSFFKAAMAMRTACVRSSESFVGTFTVVTYDRRWSSRGERRRDGRRATADDGDARGRRCARSRSGDARARVRLGLVDRRAHRASSRRATSRQGETFGRARSRRVDAVFSRESERAAASQSQADIEDAFRKEGLPGAMRKFAAIAGLDFNDREFDVELPMPTPQRIANLTFFLDATMRARRAHVARRSKRRSIANARASSSASEKLRARLCRVDARAASRRFFMRNRKNSQAATTARSRTRRDSPKTFAARSRDCVRHSLRTCTGTRTVSGSP